MKLIFLIIGFLAMALGLIGVVVPVLPTTPFLLVASFCFMRGSKGIEHWFKNTLLYQNYGKALITDKRMSLKHKLVILIPVESFLALCVLTIPSIHLKLFLLVIMSIKLYYFIFKIQTKK